MNYSHVILKTESNKTEYYYFPYVVLYSQQRNLQITLKRRFAAESKAPFYLFTYAIKITIV